MSQDRIEILNSIKPRTEGSRWEEREDLIPQILPFTLAAFADSLFPGADYTTLSTSALPQSEVPHTRYLAETGTILFPEEESEEAETDMLDYFCWFLPFHIHRGFDPNGTSTWYSDDSDCMNPELLFKLEDWIQEDPVNRSILLGAWCYTNTYASLVEFDGVKYDSDWTSEEFFEKADFSSVTGKDYYDSLVPSELKPIISWIFEVACHDD